MNLDELNHELGERGNEIDVNVEEKEEEFEEDGIEENLSSALSLLEDCWAIMEDVLDTKKKKKHKIPGYLYEKIERLSMETFAFLHQYQSEKKDGKSDNSDWWEKGDFR